MEEETTLEFFGFYRYNGQKNKLDGAIDIQPNGAFTGEIHDYGSRVPEQEIKGHIIQEGNIAKLVFLKFPPSGSLANLLYELESPITEKEPFSFARKFNGRWKALPYKIEYNEDYKSFITRIDPSVIGVGDEAGIQMHSVVD